ncbi:MAG: hypothetical protein K9I85_06545 [Saprospiraceae bacterium]|nr:hypothetical protein [Saprospiraceae bacterium]
MRNLFLPGICLILLFSGCLKDTCTETDQYILYTPVYKPIQELRLGIGMEAPRELVHPGKIYVFGNLLLINEDQEGIHLIDNSDPAQPVNQGFLAIPGNRDMAMSQGVLYADNYMDLLAFDMTDPLAPQLTSRIENVFETYVQTTEGVLIDYIASPTTVEMPCHSGPVFWFESGDVAFSPNADGGVVNQVIGVGGSTARFTLAQNHLYAVDESRLHIFDVSQPNVPSKVSDESIGWEIETIWPYQDKLFIGSRNGMFIYDCTNPAQPVQLSAFAHARACDPVVTDGRYAYVTLRSGTICEGFINQLDVIDIQSITAPVLLHSFPMTHPIGLTVKGDNLYLCDDQDGLKIFDKSDINTIDQHLLTTLTGFQAVDVIALPYNDLLLIIGQDGFRQYSVQDPKNPVFISKISTKG